MTLTAPMPTMQGKVAIVTGAGKGIGRACALMLARAGADVAIAARTQSDIDAVAAEIRTMGRRAIAVPCDVTVEAALDDLVARTCAELGKITTLVNNAGGTGPNDPRTMSGAEFTDALIWNVVPAYVLTQKVVAPMCEAGGGSIINISSVAARCAQKHFSAYGAAKAALNQMTRNLAQDFAPQVRVNAIEPGLIATEALMNYLNPEREAALMRHIPMGVLGQPEDIGAAAVFLASDAARWITGKILGVDGGMEAAGTPG